jgi:putative thioredoxin
MNNMPENENVYDVNEIDFEERVLNESKSSLILVDFWAPWCGPCKQLTPILEKITNNAKGKFKLVKINIDENQQISSQLKIQSIPAVFAFKDGIPIDAFQGIIPEGKIIEFIEKSLGEKITKDHSDFYKLIDDNFESENLIVAIDLLEEFIAENPDQIKGKSLYIEALSGLKKFDDAELFYKSLDEDAAKDQLISSAYQKLLIKIKNNNGPSLESLKAEYLEKPKDIKKILNLADKYFAENQLDESFELLLDRYATNKEKVKGKMLEFFEILGNDHDKTREYRKKLSSILFS